MSCQQVQPPTDTLASQPLYGLQIPPESLRAFLPADQTTACQRTGESETEYPERAAVDACQRKRDQRQQKAESEKGAGEQVERA